MSEASLHRNASANLVAAAPNGLAAFTQQAERLIATVQGLQVPLPLPPRPLAPRPVCGGSGDPPGHFGLHQPPFPPSSPPGPQSFAGSLSPSGFANRFANR